MKAVFQIALWTAALFIGVNLGRQVVTGLTAKTGGTA
jgi:hypothetical protein